MTIRFSYHAVVSLHAALTYKHADTAMHTQRVAEMSVSLGRGMMPVNELYVLEIAALLHDIGKIGVPDAVLTKPGRLTEEEWKLMEAHGQSVYQSSNPRSIASRSPTFSNTITAVTTGKAQQKAGRAGKTSRWKHGSYRSPMPSMRWSQPLLPQRHAVRRCVQGVATLCRYQFDPDLVERFTKLQFGFRQIAAS